MSSHLQLKVVEVTRETSEAITIYFEHPEGKIIPSKAGQFLTLIIPINGKKEHRSYSLCSAPHEAPRLAVTVKKIPGGVVSNYLVNNCVAGMEMEVMEPLGNFKVETDPATSRNMVLIGAGSGITPLMAMAKAVLHEEPKSRVTLIYGNRHEGSVIFKDTLAQMEVDYTGRFKVEHVFSQSKNVKAPESKGLFGLFKKKATESESQSGDTGKYSGRLNRKMIIQILEDLKLTDFLDTEYYLCGPEGLMEEAKEALKLIKVSPDRIHKETFVITRAKEEVPAGIVSTADADTPDADCHVVTVMYEGTEYKITVQKGETILEAGLKQDIDLPYSCQAGLCTACRGKCLSGKVHLDEREGLSDAELNEGYILNCVAHPLTNDIVIEIG